MKCNHLRQLRSKNITIETIKSVVFFYISQQGTFKLSDMQQFRTISRGESNICKNDKKDENTSKIPLSNRLKSIKLKRSTSNRFTVSHRFRDSIHFTRYTAHWQPPRWSIFRYLTTWRDNYLKQLHAEMFITPLNSVANMITNF